MKLAHLVNPFEAPPGSPDHLAQAVTFETAGAALKMSPPDVEVSLLSAQFPEDRHFAPPLFRPTEDLDRSVGDIRPFKVHRRLPLLRDILDRLYRRSDADYLIYTNADIALQPYFYGAVARIIEKGWDAFVVNRRTIPDTFLSTAEIPLMYAQVGEPHKGYDCFVFRRDAYPRYDLGNVCVGSAWVGRALLANLVAFASRFREFRDEHLTFHLGDDCRWRREELADYLEHNHGEYLALFDRLEKSRGAFAPPWRSYLLDTGGRRAFPDFP